MARGYRHTQILRYFWPQNPQRSAATPPVFRRKNALALGVAIASRCLMSVFLGMAVVTSGASGASYDSVVAAPLVAPKQGMNAATDSFRSIAVNAANAGTPGYRAMKSNVVQHADGRMEVQIYGSKAKGASVETKRMLDLALDGTGFFAVQFPFGVGYTRDGRLDVAPDGTLVTVAGRYPLLSVEHTPIMVTAPKFTVTQKGVIMQDGIDVATILVESFRADAPMKNIGGVFFYLPDSQKDYYQEMAMYTVKQGYYEESNVSISDEMVKLPMLKDQHDANTKAVKQIIKSMQTAHSIGRAN